VTESVADRLETVRAGVAEAAAQAGRDPAGITTVVITKLHPVSLVRELYALGVRDFGENRHQDAQGKAAELSDLDLTWHFVGQLQSKKARQAAAYVRVIHSLDRDSVVDALRSDERTIDAFVQLNLTTDAARGGVPDDALEQLVARVVATNGIRLLGVMAVAPLGEEPRAAFARLRAASDRVRAIDPAAEFISAGMSGDYREAILEGATHLRIGSTITGNRPTRG